MNLMKKKSKKAVLIFAVLAFLFSVSVEKTEAQCATGGTLYSFSFLNGDCTYEVSYCEYFDATTNTYVIDVVKVTFLWSGLFPCGPISINTTFMNYIKEKAINDFFLHHTDPMSSLIPPCPNQSTLLIAFKAVTCWFATQFYENGNAKMKIEHCQTEGVVGSCKTTYTICRNMTTGLIEKTQISSTSISGFLCPAGFPDLNTFVNNVSPCFGFECW